MYEKFSFDGFKIFRSELLKLNLMLVLCVKINKNYANQYQNSVNYYAYQH